ncbi:MAG: bifunctional nuclease domain-containing protein [Planctomycetota bacterium]|nr:bifunctional nuclease domain-containing protein [Planctomycetota bacterium]
MDIPVELSRIVITETSPQQVIFLTETGGGGRSFPIVIGISEALAIDRRLKGIEMPRPMTHDLLARTIEAMGGKVEKIVVSDLRDHTFIATLFVRRNGKTIQVDARPSDAIALGVGLETPIFVAEHVIDEVMNESINLAGQRENLQRRRDELIDQIDRLKRYIENELTDTPPGSDSQPLRELQGQLKEMQSELEAIEEILQHLPE